MKKNRKYLAKHILKRIRQSIVLIIAVLCIAGLANAAEKGNTHNQSFSKTKKVLLNDVYYDHRITFYCNCPFTIDQKIIQSDKYTPKRDSTRAKRVEWEHIVPAEAFGQSFPEWREGHPECISSKGKRFKGRNCARKVSINFRYMESDMYNLVPSVGEINGLRSNYSYGMIPGEKKEFGNCDMEIEDRKAEPAPEKRGNIVRTYFYMYWAYPRHGIISKKNRKLFEAWNREDPVDSWECERCKRIEKIQGNENPFVKEPCQAAGLW